MTLEDNIINALLRNVGAETGYSIKELEIKVGARLAGQSYRIHELKKLAQDGLIDINTKKGGKGRPVFEYVITQNNLKNIFKFYHNIFGKNLTGLMFGKYDKKEYNPETSYVLLHKFNREHTPANSKTNMLGLVNYYLCSLGMPSNFEAIVRGLNG